MALGKAFEAARIQELERYAILDTPGEGAFDDVTALVVRFFEVPIAIVSLVDSDRVWFKSTQGLGDVQQISRGPGLCASAIMSDHVYVSPDLRADPDALTNPLVVDESGFRFYAAAPLRSAHGYNLGTMCVIDRIPRAFSPSDQDMLQRFSRLVMAQMEQRLIGHNFARLAQEVGRKNRALTQKALHDAQTGLLNRGAIQSRLQTLCESQAAGQTLAALLFDIDHFKSVNDTHGHLAGDRALIEVAKCIVAAVRPSDYAGRFGGEEFLVILTDCDSAMAAGIAERVRSKIAGHSLRFNENEIRLTISAGVHVVEGPSSAASAMQAADQALYWAKSTGRNRVCLQPPRAIPAYP